MSQEFFGGFCPNRHVVIGSQVGLKSSVPQIVEDQFVAMGVREKVQRILWGSRIGG